MVAQVGYNAARRARIEPGDWVAVYGDGLIGQCAAQAARGRGARVILVGHRAERLALAAEHSADAVVNGRDRQVVDEVRRVTGSEHVAAVLDSVQTEQAQRQYTPLLARAEGTDRLLRVPAARAPEMYRMIAAKAEPFLGITLDWEHSR